jgi:hypothetical protein
MYDNFILMQKKGAIFPGDFIVKRLKMTKEVHNHQNTTLSI